MSDVLASGEQSVMTQGCWYPPLPCLSASLQENHSLSLDLSFPWFQFLRAILQQPFLTVHLTSLAQQQLQLHTPTRPNFPTLPPAAPNCLHSWPHKSEMPQTVMPVTRNPDTAMLCTDLRSGSFTPFILVASPRPHTAIILALRLTCLSPYFCQKDSPLP